MKVDRATDRWVVVRRATVLAMAFTLCGLSFIAGTEFDAIRDEGITGWLRSPASSGTLAAGAIQYLVVTAAVIMLHRVIVARRARARPAIWGRRRPLMYLVGCLAFSLGVELFLAAGMGLDPLHALTVGLDRLNDQPFAGIGFTDALVTLGLLAVWMVWNRSLPPIGTFITMLLVGLLIDLWSTVGLGIWAGERLPAPALMILGLLLDAYGSALIIMSGIGIRVVDLLALSMVHRLGWRFYRAKLAVEAGFLVGGFLVGGPIGVATIAFVGLVGPFTEPMIHGNRRLLRLPDHGLSRSAA